MIPIYCPITKMIFLYPVIADDGIIYEDIAINRWFQLCDISPTTGEKIHKITKRTYSTERYIRKLLKKRPDLKKKQFPISYVEQNAGLIGMYIYGDAHFLPENRCRLTKKQRFKTFFKEMYYKIS